jgi:hypothetical protein
LFLIAKRINWLSAFMLQLIWHIPCLISNVWSPDGWE